MLLSAAQRRVGRDALCRRIAGAGRRRPDPQEHKLRPAPPRAVSRPDPRGGDTLGVGRRGPSSRRQRAVPVLRSWVDDRVCHLPAPPCARRRRARASAPHIGVVGPDDSHRVTTAACWGALTPLLGALCCSSVVASDRSAGRESDRARRCTGLPAATRSQPYARHATPASCASSRNARERWWGALARLLELCCEDARG
jgi:hypothetical protein